MTIDMLPTNWRRTHDEAILEAARVSYYAWASNAVPETLTSFDSFDEHTKLYWVNIATCAVVCYLRQVTRNVAPISGVFDDGRSEPQATSVDIHEPQGN